MCYASSGGLLFLNSPRNRCEFSILTRITVWQKAELSPGDDPTKYRLDPYGARIAWADYGNTDSKTGWEIDHIIPVSRGGTDALPNLQALQWENNRRKSDNVSPASPLGLMRLW